MREENGWIIFNTKEDCDRLSPAQVGDQFRIIPGEWYDWITSTAIAEQVTHIIPGPVVEYRRKKPAPVESYHFL